MKKSNERKFDVTVEHINDKFTDALVGITESGSGYEIAEGSETFAHWVGVIETLQKTGIISAEAAEEGKLQMKETFQDWLAGGGEFID